MYILTMYVAWMPFLHIHKPYCTTVMLDSCLRLSIRDRDLCTDTQKNNVMALNVARQLCTQYALLRTKVKVHYVNNAHAGM